MPKVTKKYIESIVGDYVKSKVYFLGPILNEDLIKIRPFSFAFWKLTKEGSTNGYLMVKERDISKAIEKKRDAEEGRNLKQGLITFKI